MPLATGSSFVSRHAPRLREPSRRRTAVAQKRSNLPIPTLAKDRAPRRSTIAEFAQARFQIEFFASRRGRVRRRGGGPRGSVDSRRDGRAGRDARLGLGREPRPQRRRRDAGGSVAAGGSAFGGTPGDAALPGGKRGERPRRTSPESPLLAGADASSSSSGSPDENDRARSNPPSPRGGASPRGDALERGAPHDAPSDAASAPPATGEARRVTPLEQRRRDALEAKQRRLDGIMSRVAAARAPRDADARDGTPGGPRSGMWEGRTRRRAPASSSAPSDPPSPSPDRSNRPRRNANLRASPARRPRPIARPPRSPRR